jgi:hypothetical protein
MISPKIAGAKDPICMRANTTHPNGSATVLNGRGLRKRQLDQAQRANLAADVLLGLVTFQLSLEQAALVFHVPRYALARCVKVRRKFAAAHPEAAAGNGLLTALRGSTAPERLAAARAFGIDAVWDTLIVPVLREDKAASA